MTKLLLALSIVMTSLYGIAQTEIKNNSVPIYRITVVARTTKAINYHHQSGATKVDLKGTGLLPMAQGDADVASKRGEIGINAHFKGLQPASKFGPEFLTYVLWAITPEGRPTNLGEVLPNGDGNSKLDVTTPLQTFGLIVTAEPYYAVTIPSDVVVMENQVRNDTSGTIEQVDAKYELLKRGQYELNVNPAELKPMALGSGTPIELYEARNAIRIAKWTGANRYASDTIQKAEGSLQTAEGYENSGNRKAEITAAREAVQTAEDARVITVQKLDLERQANERQDSADAEARSRAQADSANQQKNQAEAESAQAKSDMAQSQATAAAAVSAADQSERRAQQAETEKAAMRARLSEQLNSILQTRDSARGLIVSMSDVLFDTGKYTLKPGAREKLAKVAGILLAYPGLNIEVGGYTDNVGGDEMNQKLSENRADSVRDYLLKEGVASNSITAKGFGNSAAVASNSTSAGRQENRRVELVVSGEAIGNQMHSTGSLP